MLANILPPPARFNFAQHLITLNAERAGKTALIDDLGTLSYGQLADQVQRFASGLVALGLRREDRVFLLMHDSSDWVVAFLGALHAGVVPVALNTLLTPEDYAFMLDNSRAQAALVSGAAAARAAGGHGADAARAQDSGRVAPDRRAARGRRRLRGRGRRATRPWPSRRRHAGRRGRLLAVFLGVHRQAQGHGPHSGQPVLDGRAVRQERAGAARIRRGVLRRQAVLCLRPGQRADFPAERGRQRGADGRAAHAASGVQAHDREPSHGVLRRAHRLRRHAGLARPAGEVAGQPAPVLVGRRGAAARHRRALDPPFRLRDHRRHRLDRNAARLFVEPARRRALRHHRQAGARLRDRVAQRETAKS